MNGLLIGLLGALLATNQPQAVSNLVQRETGVSIKITDSHDPREKALRQVMAGDDAAMAEVNKWIRDNNAFAAQGAGESRAELNQRIMARLNVVRHEYEDFLKQYPDFAPGHLAYGSFLNDIGDEEGALEQNEKARQLDPKDPAAWNNLANYYCENGPITNAFANLEQAIKLDPTEPVYYENLATAVYLYRRDAMAFYHISEPQVFNKALTLYRQAIKLDPENFVLATDYAESYYEIRPLPVKAALEAWTNALKIACGENEREGVYIHLARIKILAGRFAQAQAHLDAVTNAAYASLKNRLERNLIAGEKATTNATATAALTNAIGRTNSPPVGK